jgi:hypothetical protein
MAPGNAAAGGLGQVATDVTGDPLYGMAVGIGVPAITGAGANAAGRLAREHVGPMLPEVGPLSGLKQRLADEMLAKSASNPEAAAANLAFQPHEIVPGSIPHTAEVAGDIGLAKATEQADLGGLLGGNLKEIEGTQNQARRAAINEMAPERADQMAPARLFRNQMNDMETRSQAIIDQMRQLSDAEMAKIPGRVNSDEVGSKYRGELEDAYTAEKAKRDELYKAVGNPNVVVAPVREGGVAIADRIGPRAKKMAGEEAEIFKEVASLPDVAPFQDLRDIDVRLSDAMAAASRAGDNTSWARLVEMKGIVKDAMTRAVDNQAAYEAKAVRAGQMDAADTLQARLDEYQSRFSDLEQTRVSGYPETYAGPASPQEAYDPSVFRAEGEGGQGLPSSQGNSTLQTGFDARPGLSGAAKPPPDIIDAIRQFGGIKDVGGDLRARGLNEKRGIINNKNGLDPDKMREYLAEAGYLGGDTEGAVSGTTIRDMMDRIDQSLAGNRVHSVHDSMEAERNQIYRDWREQKDAVLKAQSEIERNISATGGTPVEKPILRDAAVSMVEDKLPWDTALEQAYIRYEGDKASASSSNNKIPPRDRDALRTVGDAENLATQDIPPSSVEEISGQAKKLAKANKVHAEFAQTYRQGPVKAALATYGYKGQYRATDSAIADALFKKGDASYERTKSFLSAAKQTPDAVGSVQDSAINSLRSLMKGDRLTDAALTKWKNDYRGALRAVDEVQPGFSSRFDTAAKATDLVSQAEAVRAQQIKDFQKSTAVDFMSLTDPSEVQVKVGKMLASDTGPTQVKELVKQIGSDTDALEGIRRAGVEELVSKFSNAATSGGEKELSGAKVGKFLDNNAEAMTALYGKERMSSMRRLAADLERKQEAIDLTKAKGSDSAHRMLPAIQKMAAKAGHMAEGLGPLIAAIEAYQHAGVKGAMLVGIGTVGLAGLKKLHTAGIKNVTDLYVEGLLHPSVGKEMLLRANAARALKGEDIGAIASAIARAPALSATLKAAP